MALSWWWNPILPMIRPGFSKNRAAGLHRAGLRRYRDVWISGRFMVAQEVQQAFGLLEEETGAWIASTAKAMRQWRSLIQQRTKHISSGWIGIFGESQQSLLILVCETRENFSPKAGPGYVSIPIQTVVYAVREQSASLAEAPWESRLAHARYDTQGNGAVNVIAGCVRRV